MLLNSPPIFGNSLPGLWFSPTSGIGPSEREKPNANLRESNNKDLVEDGSDDEIQEKATRKKVPAAVQRLSPGIPHPSARSCTKRGGYRVGNWRGSTRTNARVIARALDHSALDNSRMTFGALESVGGMVDHKDNGSSNATMTRGRNPFRSPQIRLNTCELYVIVNPIGLLLSSMNRVFPPCPCEFLPVCSVVYLNRLPCYLRLG